MSEVLKGRTQEDINASVARGEASMWNIDPTTGEQLSEGYTYDYDLEKAVWVGEGPEPTEEVDNSVDTIPEEESAVETAPTTDHLKRIFDYSVDPQRKWYPGTYEEFKEDYSTPENQENLYKILKNKNLIGKASKNEFLEMFFPLEEEIIEEETVEEQTEVVTPTKESAVTAKVDDSTVTPESEEPEIETTTFISLDNKEVIENDMTLDQRKTEDAARQKISYEVWLGMQIPETTEVMDLETSNNQLAAQQFEVISNFAIDAISGLGNILSQGYQMTPFGEGEIVRGGGSAKERKNAERESLENGYENWKNQYSVSYTPDNINDQSTIENFVRQRINNQQLRDSDGEIVKGFIKNRNSNTYNADDSQVDQYVNDEAIIDDYNNKRNKALQNKDARAIKRYFGVEVSDEFLKDFDVSKLTSEQQKDPKVLAMMSSLSNLPQPEIDIKVEEKPKPSSLGEAGIDVDIIDYIFSGEHGDSIDQDEFQEWYENDSWVQGQSKMRLNSYEKDGKTVYTPKFGGDLGINNKFKSTVIQKYLTHKAEKLNRDYTQYKNLGIPELVDEINAYQNQAETLEAEFTPLNTEFEKNYESKLKTLTDMNAKFESGDLEKNETNVNTYNALLKKLNESDYEKDLKILQDLEKKHDVVGENLRKKLTPKNRELLNGFSSLNDEFTNLKATSVRFLENTEFGKEYNKKIEAQLASDKYYEKYGEIGIQESLETVWNKIVDYGAGIADVINIPITDVSRKLGDDLAEERALLLHDGINNITSEYGKFLTSTKPFIDPETSEINWSRVLPSTVGTITDMALMIRGGKVSYRSINAAGKVVKKGLLKTGIKPVKLQNVGGYYKKTASTIGVGMGSMPVLFPAKLTEALEQVDENFSPEDAYNYAISSAVVEAAIETINPDFKWTRRTLADIRKVAKDPTKLLEAFKNANRTAFIESLKTVPAELLEEYLQMFSNGAINLAHNRAFDTDFRAPDYAEAKETLLLTTFSVLGMRWGSGNLYHSNDASLLRVASENYNTFVESLNKGMKDGIITEENALKLKERVDVYTLAAAEIDDMIYDEDGSVKMNNDQADRLIELITTRNALQAQIDQDPMGDLNEDLQKELDAVNESINNERNVIESEHDQHKINQNNITIKGLKDKIKDPETTKEGKKKLQEEVAKLEKENKDLSAFTPEYTFNGKSYKTKAEFLKAINTAKQNGSFKRGLRPNIKVKNDFEAEKEAYKVLGKYAPKDAKGRIIMTNKQAAEAETFIDNRTELELRTELRKELLKSKGQQNKGKIQQYKDALKYLALKEANYTFGKPGFLVQPTLMSRSELADLELEKNIEAVSKATEQFGAKPLVMSQQEVLEEFGPEAAMGNGFFVPTYDSDGNINGFSYIINKDVAKHFKARSVASHEMLHGLLFSFLNGPMRSITDPSGKKVWVRMTPEGRKLVEGFLKLLPQDQIDILNAKLDKGGYRFNEYDANGVGVPGTEKAFEEYGEEYTNMYHDAVVTDKTIPADTEQNKGIIRKIINYFNRFFNRKAPELTNINIQDSQDLFNFLKSYNKQAIEGKFNDQVIELGKRSQKAFIPAAEKDRRNEEYQAWLNGEEGAVVPSRSQQPLDLEQKSDLFSKTNQELSESLQAYGLEGEFDSKNPEHLDIWNSIPKQDKLFIGYSIGNLWRNYAKNKLFAQYGNTPKYNEYEDLILDVLTTGVEVGQNGLPYIVSTWDPTQRKLTSHIWDLLPTRIPHVTRLKQFAGFGKSLLAEDIETDSKTDQEAKKRFKLHARIGVGQGGMYIKDNQRALEINRSVRSIAQTLDTTGLTYKTLKDLRPDLTAEMFGIDVAKLDPSSKKFGANLRIDTRKGTNELLLSQMFINRNAEALLHALPEHHTVKMVKNPKTKKLEPRPDKATGVQMVLLEAFYNKGVRKDNLTPWTKKKNISVKDFLEVMGVVNNRSVRSDRNTSARVQALAIQTGKLLTNQAVREQLEADGKPMEVIQTIGDGRSAYVFSRSQRPGEVLKAVGRMDRSLSKEGKTILWDRIDEFVNYNILQTNKGSIRNAFAKTYEDVPEIINNIDKLTDSFFGVISQYNPKVIKQPVNLAVKLLETNENQFLKVKDFSGSNITARAAFRDPVRVKKMLATIKMLSNKLFDPKNPELSIAKILLMKGHLASSGRNNYLNRKQPLPGTPEFLENTLGSIPGIKYETKLTKDGKTRLSKVTYKGKNIELEKISSSQASGVALNDTKKTDNIAKRNKNEDIAQELLNDIVEFYSNLFKDVNQDFDNVDLMMVQASLLSNMNSVLARAAKLKFISENAFGFKNPGQELKYEHMQPRVAVLMNMFDAHINGDGISDVKEFLKNYNVAIIPNTMDDVITEAQLGSSLYTGQTLGMPAWIRYFNEKTRELADGRMVTLLDATNNMEPLRPSKAWVDSVNILKSQLFKTKRLNKAVQMSRSAFDKFQLQKQKGKQFVKNLKTKESFDKFQAQKRKGKEFVESILKKPKGITVLDFDDTLATTKSLVKFTRPDGTTGTLNAEEYASTYEDLLDQGFTFDFSDFNKVVKGKLAPLFQKALKLQNKFGPENMFILTARPMEAQKAIFDFLKANGLDIPMKNITGLGNSTAEAKALWIADKVAEGYNDFYFADDALQNVQAVDNMLEQFDVKRKVQQAKLQFSKSINTDFNDILEETTGVESKKRFSDIKARKRGADKGKFRFFIPPSHEDFVGLLYNFMGKGRKGDAHRDFFEQNLIRPLNRAYREIDTAKQAIANDYKSLNKQFPDVKNKLTKKTEDGDFTFQDAIRVYLWNKHGYEIPGLNKTDQGKLVELVANDSELRAYAETLNIISKQDTYVNPGQGWEGGNIKIDLIDATGRVGRAEYFTEFQENADLMFSEENLNKIEAVYGKDFRSALEDMLYRIKTGVNRPKGQSKTINAFMNYLNGSVGAVMFFNMRSAILQQMSIVNYLNFADNNIYAAGKAFANQKQYWKDFAYIFNSDMLKQRRGGIGTDINGAELAEAVNKSKNPTRAIIGKLLQLGFTPTQIGDNIAIAIGGSTFYRNRINKYVKDGFSQKEAQEKAWTDFQNITQSTQQSARPDKTSQQQSMWIGKMVLNFQNITSQYNRLIKRSASDIYNRRITPPNTTQFQSDASNMSRILYYGAIQNLVFYSLQTALFAVMFGDQDEDEEKFLKKKERVINGTFDSILRGSGIYGVAVSTLKNMAIKWHEQRQKSYNKDESAVLMEALNFSPVVGIKARKIVNAEKTINYNESVISEMETFDSDNPAWSSATNYVEALTNFPANRLYQKSINIRNSLDNDYKAWQRALFFSGYTTWSLGLGDTEKMTEIKETIKVKKKEASIIKREEKKQEKLKLKEAEGVEKQKKEKKEGKQVTCLVCKLPVQKGKKYCTVHEKTEQRKDGKKVQCRKRKKDGKRCAMTTTNKSGYCYYHD